ncbi:TetR family transcriptional regulator [Nocardioides sp. AN3]
MPQTDTRARMVDAAFALFSEQGFEQTTVDQIAALAGVGRTTFFRMFASKEAVLFPDHERLLAAVDLRLRSASSMSSTIALIEAATIVLDHYLAEGDVARKRYALTRSVPALRAAETSSLRSYQRVFRDHTAQWGYDDLTADLIGAGVVAAHNHVLRRWLLKRTDTPHADLAAAVTKVTRMAESREESAGSQVIVLDTRLPTDEVVAALRKLQDDRRTSSGVDIARTDT